MILKTYARVFTNDANKTLELFQKLHQTEPHLRLNFNDWELIAIGDTFIVGGTDESLVPIRDSHGPYIVDNLDETRSTLLEGGAEITQEIKPAPTGRFLYAKHSDGLLVEYVELNSDLVEKWIAAPLRNGKLSSQI
ncbi:VOC family protein (plasmid) [Nostoc sp. C052]|uniref:VOC family protein n=1 Tax=Nostoc sp. C052 TaxID=2576902 RepID=UPI0015C3B4FB|nr:VOC family protein [Nostoc sp. C052]QLE46028.1 VOC family protein [Nostoc sp. C052]